MINGDVMINFNWNNHDFCIVQFGNGIFRKDMVGHSHSKNSYELHYIIGGEGSLITDSKTYPLSKGDFFVTGPNIYHQQTTNHDKPLNEIYIYLQTSDEKTNDALVSVFLSTHFFFCRNENLSENFEKILIEENDRKFGYKSAIGALMQYLLTQITRIYAPQFNCISENSNDLNDRRFILIETAFIDDPKGITLGKLSGMIGLCERQTQRLLLKYYGKSFKEKKSESQNKGLRS